jgi:putative permease
MEKNSGLSYRQVSRLVFLAAGLAVAVWVAHSLLVVLLIFFLAVVIGIVLNAPVVWLETKKIPRPAAALIVLVLVLGAVGGIGWLVLPRLLTEARSLIDNLPTYSKTFGDTLARVLHSPSIAQRFQIGPNAAGNWFSSLVPKIGLFSLSLIPTLVILLFLVGMSLYLVFSPRSMLRSYVAALPPRARKPHMDAFTRGSQLVVGWLWSNIILGVIQAIAAWIFLFAIGVPGAVVWAALALFAELIPVLGAYIMALPPIIVALAVRPALGLWVVVFYLGFNVIKDYVLVPLLRNVTMQLNPVYMLLVTLAMTYLFGIIGAVVAAPLAGFAKAYYDEFYLSRQTDEPHMEEKIDMMVRRETVEAGLPGGPLSQPGETDQQKTQTAMEQEERGSPPRIAQDSGTQKPRAKPKKKS